MSATRQDSRRCRLADYPQAPTADAIPADELTKQLADLAAACNARSRRHKQNRKQGAASKGRTRDRTRPML